MCDEKDSDSGRKTLFERGLFLYKIIADYRSSNTCKPEYYVIAKTTKEAKQKFSNMITWLKIYGCERVSLLKDSDEILSHPEKHIII